MNLLGHGIDMVEVDRLAASLERQGDRFLERVYKPAEVAYADANPKRRVEHLAARFAVKEAAMKALGTGWTQGVAFTDFEVVRDALGAPSLRVSGAALDIACERGIATWSVSLSHTRGIAIASVLALG